MPSHDTTTLLLLTSTVSLLNGMSLGLILLSYENLRRSGLVRFLTLIYITMSIGLYLVVLPADARGSEHYPYYILAMAGYFPLYLYIFSRSAEMLVELLVLRGRGGRDSQPMQRWRQKLLKVVRGGERRIVERKLDEARQCPTDPQLHRELVELYLALGETDRAVYHAYALVEVLPNGHAHARALYRIAQILVDRQAKLETAQPYLRRIIRLYPRSFFASYARRLINKYEASVDETIN